MSSKHINKKYLYIFDGIILVIGVLIDRLIKRYALIHLKNHPSKSIISGALELEYLENSGAAFGLLKNQQSFFILVTIISLIACIYVLIKTPDRKKYILTHILLSIIITGAIGNSIDRAVYGYVIDYIYVISINFPIFNFADILVTLGSFFLIFCLLFYYKEDDLNYLRFNEKKLRDIE